MAEMMSIEEINFRSNIQVSGYSDILWSAVFLDGFDISSDAEQPATVQHAVREFILELGFTEINNVARFNPVDIFRGAGIC